MCNTINIRFQEETKTKIEEIAKKEERTPPAQIRHWVKEGLKCAEQLKQQSV